MIFLLFTGSILGQNLINTSMEDEYLSLLGKWTDGVCKTVFRQDNFLFVGNGCNVYILDVADHFSPVILSSVGSEYPVGFAQVMENYLYIGSESGSLTVVDISNILFPQQITSTSMGSIRDMKIEDGFLFMLSNLNLLRIVDISNPFNPIIISTTNIGAINYKFDVKDDYLYVAAGLDGLKIIDISELSSPIVINVIDFPCYADDVHIVHDFVLVSNEECGIRIFDISDPTQVEEIICFDEVYSDFVYVHGDYAVSVANVYGSYLDVIDISDINNPINCGSHVLPDNSSDVLIVDEFIYVPNNDGLSIVGCENPYALNLIYFYDTPAFASDVAANDSLAFVLDCYDGLYVLNISNPDNITVLSSYSIEGIYGYRIFYYDHIAYLVYIEEGLIIVDLSDPLQPVEVGEYSGLSLTQDVFVKDSIAVIVGGNVNYFAILLNVNDPANVTEVSSVYFDSHINTVFIDGDYLYVTEKHSGLHIIDISDPTSPVITSFLEIPLANSFINSVFVADNIAYISCYVGIKIVDVSDPYNPYILIEYGTLDIDELLIQDHYAFCAQGDEGIRLFDVSDPVSPVELYYINTPGYATGIYYADNIYYCADMAGGLYLYEIKNTVNVNNYKQPANISLAVYPNPIRNYSVLEYSIDKEANVNIVLFDLFGNAIASLVDEKKQAGNYKFTLNPSIVSDLEGTHLIALYLNNELAKTVKAIILK